MIAPDHFFFKNRLNDMVRALFSSLNIGTYILPTSGPLSDHGGMAMPLSFRKNALL
jgi:hypothetical protein